MLIIFGVGAIFSYFIFQHTYSMSKNTTVQQEEIQLQTESTKSEYVTMLIQKTNNISLTLFIRFSEFRSIQAEEDEPREIYRPHDIVPTGESFIEHTKKSEKKLSNLFTR